MSPGRAGRRGRRCPPLLSRSPWKLRWRSCLETMTWPGRYGLLRRQGPSAPGIRAGRRGILSRAHLAGSVKLLRAEACSRSPPSRGKAPGPSGPSSDPPVWIRAQLSAEAARAITGKPFPMELVIVPAFNLLCGGLPFNELTKKMRGPLPTMADWTGQSLYLLDGTDLGTLAEIRAVRNRQQQRRDKNYCSYKREALEINEIEVLKYREAFRIVEGQVP